MSNHYPTSPIFLEFCPARSVLAELQGQGQAEYVDLIWALRGLRYPEAKPQGHWPIQRAEAGASTSASTPVSLASKRKTVKS